MRADALKALIVRSLSRDLPQHPSKQFAVSCESFESRTEVDLAARNGKRAASSMDDIRRTIWEAPVEPQGSRFSDNLPVDPDSTASADDRAATPHNFTSVSYSADR